MVDTVHFSDLSSEEVFRIKGKMRGSILSQRVLVCEDAEFVGNIFAVECRIQGRVKGSITAKLVRAADTAAVLGSITTHPGGFLSQGAARISAVTTESPMVEAIILGGMKEQHLVLAQSSPSSDVDDISSMNSSANSILREARDRLGLSQQKAAQTSDLLDDEMSTTPDYDDQIGIKPPFIFSAI